MKIDRSDINKNLPKKGFIKEESGHHIRFHHIYKGKRTGVYTYISHSKKLRDFSGDILRDMRKQLELDKIIQVVDLCKCPMSENDYVDILKQKEIIPSDF
jgi:hypothetical protein